MKSYAVLTSLHPRYWVSYLGVVTLLTLMAQPVLAQEDTAQPDPNPEDAAIPQTIAQASTQGTTQDTPIQDTSPTPSPSDRTQNQGDRAEKPAPPDNALTSEASVNSPASPVAESQGLESQTANPQPTSPLIPSTASGNSAPSSDGSSRTPSGAKQSGTSPTPPVSAQASPVTSATPSATTDTTATPPKLQILSPAPDAAIAQPSATLVIEAPLDSTITLMSNGVAVDTNQIGQVATDAASGVVRQTWYGVPLKEGANLITVTATLPNRTVQTAERRLMLRGAIDSLHLETLAAQIPADGRSTVTVHGYFLDKNGNLSNRGGRVTLTTSAGTFVGTDVAPDVDGFQIDANQGEFSVELQSSVETGLVQIHAEMLDLKADTQVQFGAPSMPNGIVAGSIDLRFGPKGTNYFSRFGDFLPPNEKHRYGLDVNGAVFLRGSFGDWLLTGAFNTDRDLNDTCTNCTGRLRAADQASEKIYPTYGDQSTITHLTPSEDQVYLRLERTPKIPFANPDYVMWGSYDTGREFATSSQEFTAFSRQMQGAKLNYNLGNLQISALYSQGGEAYQRDTILPDGTRGYYFLSQRLVVPGSEEVYEELEVLERPGTVVTRERLNRISDYDIDYDRGTLFFNDPQLRTEIDNNGEVLVRRLIVSYQYKGTGNNTHVYGGRLQYHLDRQPGEESRIGATYLKEDKGDRRFSLYGADFIYSLDRNNHLIAEYAHSDNNTNLTGDVQGNAYRFEFTGQWTSALRGRAYYRHADTGFANQSTISFVPGQTRYGLEAQAQIRKNTTLRFNYDHQDDRGVSNRPILQLGDLLNLDTYQTTGSPVNSSLTTISAGVQQRFGQVNLTSDWIYRDRVDHLNPAQNSVSSQIRTLVTAPITSNLQLRLLNQTTVTSSADSVYSDRTQLGLDWRLLKGMTIQLNQDWYTRGPLAGQSRTSVNLGSDYTIKVAKNTSISARYGLQRYDNGNWGDTLDVGKFCRG